jgi:site-specific DNA-methyltransferase (adenine-specific)
MIPETLAHLAIAIDSIQPHPRNVRQGDVGAISESLKLHGQYRPIVVQKSTGHILAGNHTYKAAKALKWKQIAATYVDVTDDQAVRILLMDNRANDLASYDDPALADILKQLMETEQRLEGTGFDPDDLEQLLRDIDAEQLPTVMGDPDEVPEDVPAKTVPGDVWLLGRHRLRCGDSTSPTDMDALMNGKQADIVWTDPPYGVAYVGKTKDALTIKNDALDKPALTQFLRDSLGNAAEHTKPGGVWYVAAPPGDLFQCFSIPLTDLGIWRHTLVWVKDSFVMGRADYHYRHEAIFYGWKPGAAHKEPPDRKQDSVWEIARPKRNAEHPTMKPVALIERALTNSSNYGELVLDPFGGSGSTLIAAEQTNRTAYLMELDPHYCDVICARFQKATGIKPIAEATGNEHDFL